MIDQARKAAEKQLAEMEENISAIYQEAMDNVTKEWTTYVKSQKELVAALQQDYWMYKNAGYMREAREVGAELGRQKAALTLKDAHYKRITEATAERLADVNQTAVAYVNGQLPGIYALSYNAVEDSLISGIAFNLVNESTVRYMMTQDPTLVPLKTLNKYKDIAWNRKQMNSSVLQGIIQGESMDKIADRLYPIVNRNEASAIRNARTMVTSAENKGRLDSYKELDSEGVVLTKIWYSSSDGRTRDWHVDMYGQEVGIDEMFIDGHGNELEYPGDPGAEPETVYNCRCTMQTRIIGFRKSNGRIEYV